MRHFCLLTNRLRDPELLATQKVTDYLTEKNCTVMRIRDEVAPEKCSSEVFEEIPQETECCIVLGGDGTLIHTARALSARNIPVVGVNIGTLGFLSVIEQNELYDALDKLISNDFDIENRMMIEADIYLHDNVRGSFNALNDVVMSTSGISRIVGVRVLINNEPMGKYVGNGVLVSTPTGSTGYNLSAGGPVVTPCAELMLVTPICPHSLNSRSVVVSGTDEIEIELLKDKRTKRQAMISIDGQETHSLKENEIIRIRKSEKCAKFIRFRNKSFFEILDRKLSTTASSEEF